METTPTLVLRGHLDTADRTWFDALPTAQWRKRRFVPGEDSSTARFRPGVTHTAVSLRPDESLARQYFRAVEA